MNSENAMQNATQKSAQAYSLDRCSRRDRPGASRLRQWALVVWLSVAVGSGFPLAAHADTVRVAVASNFAQAADSLASAFAAQTGHTAQLSRGSSGQLFAQIHNGAPFDVFLSADTQRPRQLAELGLAVASSQFTYAMGQLVLWSATPGLVDTQGQVLRQSPQGNTRLALANPKLAPYGAAAAQTLESMGLSAQWKPRLVMGENIAQTHQFVATGNAQLGFVALSQVMRGGQFTSGSGWVVPSQAYAPIAQDAILLTSAQHQAAAQAWMAFLKSETAAKTIRSAGYLR
jgi:molybdate transport system substrate-binding protein